MKKQESNQSDESMNEGAKESQMVGPTRNNSNCTDDMHDINDIDDVDVMA